MRDVGANTLTECVQTLINTSAFPRVRETSLISLSRLTVSSLPTEPVHWILSCTSVLGPLHFDTRSAFFFFFFSLTCPWITSLSSLCLKCEEDAGDVSDFFFLGGGG